MSTSMADLGFNIDSKPMKLATSELNKMSGAAGKAEKSTTGLSSAASVLKTAMIGLAGAISAREVFQLGDAWQGTTNQLKQVTTSTNNLVEIQGKLVDISKETRSNFESTANLYARLARSTDQMGLSQSELLGITETINKSFAASGATATEAAAAITQLSQGLAAGALRGDEFNSVSEQAPAIMRAIAKSLKMTIGELRAFAAEGGITAEIVVTALQKASGSISNDFGKTVSTFGQSMEVARTNMMQFVGESSAITGAISTAGDAVVWLTENIDKLTMAASILGAAGLAGMMTSAAMSMSAYTIVMKGAIAAQIAFNAVAAINPWVLIAAAIAGTVAAVYSFVSAQESAIEVWEKAKESEEAYQAAKSSGKAQERQAEIEKELISLAEERQDIEDRGWQTHIYKAQRYNDILIDQLVLESEKNQIKTQQALAESASSARQKAREEEAANSAKRQLELEKNLADAKAATAKAEQDKLDKESLADMEAFIAIIDDELSLLVSLKDAYGDTTKATRDFSNSVQLLTEMFNMTGNEEFLRMIERMAKEFENVGEYSGEKSAEKFINSWDSAAQTVAGGLQDALASGDWSSLGDAIGSALSVSISAVVSKSITDSLAQNITANSSVLAQIGGAFAGPIAGALVGAAIQIALKEAEKYFSDNVDQTESRQSSLGTGTILGSINKKTESIKNATDLSATASGELIGINRDMLRALNEINSGISSATARIGGADLSAGIATPDTRQLAGSGFFGDAMETYLDYLSLFTWNLLDLGKLLGGRSRKTDQGINIVGGYISDLVDETIIGAYQTFRVKKNVFDDYDTSEVSQRIGGEVEKQFELVFESIFDGVEAATATLGIDASKAMSEFKIDSTKISLEGLDAEGQQAALEAFFSSVFDNLAASAAPFLEEFQKAGEGLGETLTRLATIVQVSDEAMGMLGVQFTSFNSDSIVMLGTLIHGTAEGFQEIADQMTVIQDIKAKERLIELSGGIETFINSTSQFVRNFMDDSKQFELNSDALARAMGAMDLPETREGFLDLMQAQDAATESGAENIATLLRLQGAASQYYDYLEDREEERIQNAEEAARELERIAADEAKAASDAARELLAGLSSAMNDSLIGVQNAINAERELAASRLNTAQATHKAAIDNINSQRSEIEARRSAAKDAVANSGESLKSSFSEEISKINQASTARIDALNSEIQTANSAASAHRAYSSELKSLSDTLASSSLSMSLGNKRAGAQDDLSSALSAAKGGDFGKAQNLDLSALGNTSGQFSSASDLAMDIARTQNQLDELSRLSGGKASGEERAAMAAESSAKSLERQIELEQENAAAQIQALEDQMNALLGIDTTILSIEDAIAAYTEAQAALEGARFDDLLGSLDGQEQAANDALDSAESAYADQIDSLDSMLELAQQQVDAAYGIETGVKSVRESIDLLFLSVDDYNAEMLSRAAVDSEQQAEALEIARASNEQQTQMLETLNRMEESQRVADLSIARHTASTSASLDRLVRNGIEILEVV